MSGRYSVLIKQGPEFKFYEWRKLMLRESILLTVPLRLEFGLIGGLMWPVGYRMIFTKKKKMYREGYEFDIREYQFIINE